MALKVMEKDIAETEDIPVVAVTSTDIASNIKEYHVYKSVWTPILQEQVYGQIEPHSPVDKYAVTFKTMKKWLDIYHYGKMESLLKQFFTFFVLIPMGNVT